MLAVAASRVRRCTALHHPSGDAASVALGRRGTIARSSRSVLPLRSRAVKSSRTECRGYEIRRETSRS